MTTYKYTAISKDGAKVSGVVDGYNELDAVDRIKESCSIVLKISEVTDGKPGFLNMEVGGNKLNSKAFTVMCSQFAIILRSGVPIARTCHLIAEKTTDKPLKKMLTQVAEDVEAGRSLAVAFRDRGSKLLPQTFVETIRAGEESGNVDRAFENMYQHYDKQMKMKNKVKSALTYPAFVMLVAIVVVIVLMVKVVPTFTDIFASYGSELPAITLSLIAVSNFFKKYTWLLVLIAVIIGIVYKIYGNTEEGRMRLAKIQLKLPVLGEIAILNAASEFANTMTTMLGAGLSIPRAISITARVLDNYYISQSVGKLTAELETGRTLGDSMREAAFMPAILTDMVAVGEDTGELEATLNTIALYYDAELEMAISQALGKLEPTILVFIAAIAGYIVLAIYIAMFSMYGIM